MQGGGTKRRTRVKGEVKLIEEDDEEELEELEKGGGEGGGSRGGEQGGEDTNVSVSVSATVPSWESHKGTDGNKRAANLGQPRLA